jgi:hypothetical protein
MGYDTDFKGAFTFDRPLTVEHANVLAEFAEKDHREEHTLSAPSAYCQWVPSQDGTKLVWDGGEKFYDYVGWLKYLIKHYIEPWGYKLNGEVTWQGEDSTDMGKIVVEDSDVRVLKACVTYKEKA